MRLPRGGDLSKVYKATTRNQVERLHLNTDSGKMPERQVGGIQAGKSPQSQDHFL